MRRLDTDLAGGLRTHSSYPPEAPSGTAENAPRNRFEAPEPTRVITSRKHQTFSYARELPMSLAQLVAGMSRGGMSGISLRGGRQTPTPTRAGVELF